MEASATQFPSECVPRCGSCHDVIGVYEPLVRVSGGSVQYTSRAAGPLLGCSGERLYHLGCYESLDRDL
jgi:hypothetical protein